MIRTHILPLALIASFMISGCKDKIEEANRVEPAPQPQNNAAHPPVSQLPVLNLDSKTPDLKGLRVVDLFEQRASLSGKTVTIRGTVSKVSEGIMGKTWIHIQDGSGTEGSNDIVFTSSTQTAAVGDRVTATGVLSVDKDFGYGYFYPVIVEEATFSKQ